MPEDNVFPVDPVVLKLADGKPRELRYTNGSFKRLKKAVGVRTMREVFELEFSEIAGAIIHVGLVDNADGLTPDQIDDLIPVPQLGEVQAVVLAAISGSSVDDTKNALRAAGQQQGPQPETTTNPDA